MMETDVGEISGRRAGVGLCMRRVWENLQSGTALHTKRNPGDRAGKERKRSSLSAMEFTTTCLICSGALKNGTKLPLCPGAQLLVTKTKPAGMSVSFLYLH